jgi:membrane associated rhomboid family serine protease
MTEIPLVADGLSEQIDVCTGCHLIWFDRGEFEALPRTASRKPTRRKLTDEQIDALALARLEQVKSRQYAEETGADHWWEVPLAFCGIPIEYNRTPLRSRPVVTWLLAAVIAAVSVAAFRDLPSAVKGWGLIPAEFGRHFGLTFFTSFLLHGGILHLLGNLYYLVVFGDNSEDILGKGRYLLLIALAVVVGDIAHIISDPGSTTPCVGASGGISGVLAYYCLRFPHAKVGIIFWLRWFRMPVIGMFALWILLQVITLAQQSAGFGRVAVFAHLGGAGVGVLFWLATRQTPGWGDSAATKQGTY